MGGEQPRAIPVKQNQTREGPYFELAAHQEKLVAYASNPYANDNKAFLGHGCDGQIIAGRVKKLVNQILNLQKLLEEWERRNGLR